MAKTAAYGTWTSPITAELVTGKTITLAGVQMDGGEIYWAEGRPTERGRVAVVRRRPDGQTEDVIAMEFNARTRVHEYGGGAWLVVDGTLYFANFADQFVYRVERGREPVAIHAHEGKRFADYEADRGRNRLYAVCEDHTAGGHQPANSIVALGMNGGPVVTLVSGNDFYSNPRLSPDATRLVWLTWNHPNMPWDGTELWLADIAADGSLTGARKVAGGATESVFQPEWAPDGRLYFVSDRTGWWNLYRLEGDTARALCPLEAEFGLPQWAFGRNTYTFASADEMICAYTQKGVWHLARLDLQSLKLTPIVTPYTVIDGLTASGRHLLFVGASATEAPAVVLLDLETGERSVLRQAFELNVPAGYISPAQPVEFPTTGGRTAYGLFYAPQNQDFAAPAGERPPMIVLSHGGPTGSASAALSLGIQYWTSRGFAVLDVNYGGSTGYGRAYRERLKGTWGITDVDDCAAGARYLAEQGLVDGERLIIRGGSAGGYTTLAALTFRDLFKCGVSMYGIGDLSALAADTHKFEARYLDGLVGPYPAAAETYRARSPIHHTERLSCPIIFFQGLEDKVVPPNQAEMMVAALKSKGIPVAYVAYEGEGHGFRRAENIKRTLEAQLYFFGKVFGFEPGEAVAPVEIANLA